MTDLIIDDKSINIKRDLAEEYGMHEAIMLEMINIWIKDGDSFKDTDEKEYIKLSIEGITMSVDFFEKQNVLQILGSLYMQGAIDVKRTTVKNLHWYSVR